MIQPGVLKAAVAVNVLAFVAWLACWLGHADPFLRVLFVASPLVLAAVVTCLYAAFSQRRWWALLAVVPALWAYTPIIMLFTIGLATHR